MSCPHVRDTTLASAEHDFDQKTDQNDGRWIVKEQKITLPAKLLIRA